MTKKSASNKKVTYSLLKATDMRTKQLELIQYNDIEDTEDIFAARICLQKLNFNEIRSRIW